MYNARNAFSARRENTLLTTFTVFEISLFVQYILSELSADINNTR